MAKAFRQKTRDEWCTIIETKDVCFAPVLTMSEAKDHPHAKAREAFVELGGVTQPAPAPRFSRTPGKAKIAPPVGTQTAELLLAVGYARHEAEAMFASGAVGGASGAKL